MATSPLTSLDPAVRLHPRSSRPRSRSPERKALFHQHDLLLSDLTPETTLQLLSAADAVPLNNKDTSRSLLARSISDVSTVDRAFGIRAAVAAQKLNEWHTELLSWLWPGSEQERAAGTGFLPPKSPQDAAGTSAAPNGEDYFGCLPASALHLYKGRIRSIQDGMDALDVEELKEHVLTAHVPSRSRPPSAGSMMSTNSRAAGYLRMSDFTAVITATILRALPVLSKLNNLLGSWHCRLLVLSQVPGLLSGLKDTRRAIDIALSRLQEGMLPGLDDPSFSRASFRASWKDLQGMVSSLGRRIDGILDILEGREDSLPDTWIDEMELIESKFATWAFEAERRALQNELRGLYQLEVDRNLARNVPKNPTSTDDSSREESGSLSDKLADIAPTTPSLQEITTPGSLLANLQNTSCVPLQTFTESQAPNSVNASKTTPEKVDRVVATPRHQGESANDVEDPHNVDSLVPVQIIQGPQHNELGLACEENMAITDNYRVVSPDTSPASIAPLVGLRKRPSRREKPIPSKLQLIPSGSDATIKQGDTIPSITASDHADAAPSSNDANPSDWKIPKGPETPAHISPDFSSGGSVIHHTPETSKDTPSSRPNSTYSSPESLTPPSVRSFERTMSWPLARFINDEAGSVYESDSIYNSNGRSNASDASLESTAVSPKILHRDSTHERQRNSNQWASVHSGLRRSVSSTTISSSPRFKEDPSNAQLSNFTPPSCLRRSPSSELVYLEKSPISIGTPETSLASTPLKPLEFPPKLSPPARSTTPDSPSNYTEIDPLEHTTPPKPKIHPILKTPSKSSHDQLDDRIHSILDTIPTKIRLKSAVSEDTGDRPTSDNLRVPKNAGRTRPSSPTPSRSSTPTPSLTLTPAYGRSKRSRNNPGPDDVRLYHLHRGGKAAPVRLFVRLVGETGERVMVRVGGGWADLGEYLREYAMHHGRRGIIDGRFEVQGIPVVSSYPRSSTPTNGRSTPAPPSRPGSAMDVRPGSSLAIHKTRRATGSGPELLPNLTAANIQRLSEEGVSPANSSFISSQRRPSISSATSMSMASAIGDTSFNTTPSHRSFSTATNLSRSTPLGLAGPKPRSKQHTISPESEAWVEDVMGQARRSSSSLRARRSMTTMRSSSGILRRMPSGTLNEQSPTPSIAMNKVRSENKLRSASDMGSVSLNKRVFLRRLGKEKE